MAAKILRGKARTTKFPAPTTLAEVLVVFTDHRGAERAVHGGVIARHLARMAFLTCLPVLGLDDEASDTAPAKLRGLGALLLPDPGEPLVVGVDRDRWHFVGWALQELSAQLRAEQIITTAGDAAKFTVVRA